MIHFQKFIPELEITTATSQRPVADIRSVEQILAADALDSGKSLVVSRLQIRCRSQDHEDAAAVGDKRMTCLVESLVALSKLLERRTHVIDMHGRVIENLQSKLSGRGHGIFCN